MAELEQRTDHCIVHTGQNYDYELSQVFFDDLDIRKPDYFLDAAGSSAAETIGLVVARVDTVLQEVRPDAFLVLGDTNSCLSAIAAKRRKIPIFHMEAGNRCFDERVPEEINRRIVDHIADINMPYSDISRQYLLREGIAPERVIKTGSPMKEVIDYYRPKIRASNAVERLGVESGDYFVVSAHREENVDDPHRLAELGRMLNGIASRYGRPLIFSTHPRTRSRLQTVGIELDPLVRLLPPFGFTDYVRLQTEARAVLSDSGTITEESSILNFPALNIRSTHERPEGMEEGAVILTGMSLENVLRGLDLLEAQPRGGDRILQVVSDYDVANVSKKVVRIICSYIDYVREYVWHEPR